MAAIDISKLDIACLQKASILLQGVGTMINEQCPTSGKEAAAIGQHLHDLAVKATVQWAKEKDVHE
ncbi:MAG: hypothetical protein ACK4NR_09395 [Micavibrio sp.]